MVLGIFEASGTRAFDEGGLADAILPLDAASRGQKERRLLPRDMN